jgi:hypothetical protein
MTTIDINALLHVTGGEPGATSAPATAPATQPLPRAYLALADHTALGAAFDGCVHMGVHSYLLSPNAGVSGQLSNKAADCIQKLYTDRANEILSQ